MADVDIPKHWKPGEPILQQDIWLGKLLVARPVTVVEDRSDLLALYTHAHSQYMAPVGVGGGRYSLSLEDRVARMMSPDLLPFERRSSSRNVLTLTPPESRHSVWFFWGENWQLECCYVNFQRPIRRSKRGVIVQDTVLDIRIEPNGSWKWKDEDEFALMHERGFFTDEEAATIRAEGDRMVQKIESKSSPFSDGWENWRPDPKWPKLQIPKDWQVVD